MVMITDVEDHPIVGGSLECSPAYICYGYRSAMENGSSAPELEDENYCWYNC